MSRLISLSILIKAWCGEHGSNPATYTSVFDDIRELYSETNEAKMRGYDKGRFSFNVKAGAARHVKVMELKRKLKCTFSSRYLYSL